MGNIIIYSPTADITESVAAVTLPSLTRISDKVIGLMGNNWRCVPQIWEIFGEVLKNRYYVSRVFTDTISNSWETPADVLDDVARRADAVVVALAN